MLQIGSRIIKLIVHQFTFNTNFSPGPGHENHENAKHVTSHLELTQKGSGEDHAPQRKTAGEWQVCIINAWGNYKNINGIRLLIFFSFWIPQIRKVTAKNHRSLHQILIKA